MIEKQVVSKYRVANHGEVYTRKREVNAMLDLVKQETERIESRFLEPACGTGNFLTAILERKLRVVEQRYKRSQLEFERYAVLAVSSIYGIDVLRDNVEACRKRLFDIFDKIYNSLYKKRAKTDCRNTVIYILGRNIIWGDALTLRTVGDNRRPIVFSEWALVNGSMLKRRDFTMSMLIQSYLPDQRDLFPQRDLFSELDEEAFIPTPEKEYPLIHFLKIGNE